MAHRLLCGDELFTMEWQDTREQRCTILSIVPQKRMSLRVILKIFRYGYHEPVNLQYPLTITYRYPPKNYTTIHFSPAESSSIDHLLPLRFLGPESLRG